MMNTDQSTALDRIAAALEALHRQGGANGHIADLSPFLEDLRTIRERQESIFEQQDAMCQQLGELRELIVQEKGEIVKEFYSTREVAKRTGLAEYTIRQACNTGRIDAEKAGNGKGSEWRIPHATLQQLLQSGLPSKTSLKPAPGHPAETDGDTAA
jgi:excisionase family DNA binding protein